MQRIALVLAGGSGERFWPLSQGKMPKQLLKLLDPEKTLLEQTLERVEPIFGEENVFVITSKPLAEEIRSALPHVGSRLFAEPEKRNTAGAAVWGMALIDHLLDPQDISFGIFPSDHSVSDDSAFAESVKAALSVSESTDSLVTIGIKPDRPETGYGYIERIGEPDGSGSYAVKQFTEKPSASTAGRYLKSGNYLWNSGILCCRVQSFFEQLSICCPAHYNTYREIRTQFAKSQTVRAEEAFRNLESISVDHAVLEKSRKIRVVEAKFGWDDVGAWDSLERSLPKDENGNVAEGEAALLDSHGCIVYNGVEGQKVHVLGGDELIIVTTPEAVMVCRKDQAQDVKRFLKP